MREKIFFLDNGEGMFVYCGFFIYLIGVGVCVGRKKGGGRRLLLDNLFDYENYREGRMKKN